VTTRTASRSPLTPLDTDQRADKAEALTTRELLLVDAIAERVAERLRAADDASRPPRSPRSPRLVDARSLAEALDVDLKSIYRHADKLGAVRVGRRLRFDLDRALRSWSSDEDDRCPSEGSQPLETPAPKPTPGTRQQLPSATRCRLLPVGRRTGAQ
jgi:hypothetical protein